jgi:UPF0148 protein
MRRGAILLREPCPRCGGIQVRYQNRTYCVAEDDLGDVVSRPVLDVADVVAQVRELVTTKTREVAEQLGGEKDVERQAQLAALLLKYLELIDRTTPPPEETPGAQPASR